MNPSLQPQQPLSNSTPFFTSIAIILLGVLISCGVLITTGAFSYSFDSLLNVLPKINHHQKMQDLSARDSIDSVLAVQPVMSYNSDAKYVLVEISDFDCMECANFHGNDVSGDSFNMILKDFIYKGKLDYVMLDHQAVGDITKNTSAYCVAEQDTEKYFQYSDLVYKNFGVSMTKDRAKALLSKTNFSPSFNDKKFEECFDSKKYNQRVLDLTDFTDVELEQNTTPTFQIYSVTTKDVKKLDGKTEKQKTYTLVKTFKGTQDYKLLMKPEIEKIVNK